MPDFQDDERLGGAFAGFRDELASQVRPAGVAATYVTVRSRRRVRAVTTTAAVAFLLAVPVAAYAVTTGDPDGPPEDPATPRPTVEVEPSPSPAAEPSPSTAPPSPEQPATQPPPELPELAGQAFYMDSSGRLYVDGEQYPGGSYLSLNVSPDGRYVSWVDEGSGDALVSNVDGSGRETLYWDADGMCVEPVWSYDDRKLFHDISRSPSMVVITHSVGTGLELGEPVGCHYRWSADGERLAAVKGDLSGVIVMNSDGSDQRLVTVDVEGRTLADLVSISADGSRISVQAVPAGSPVGDVARSLVGDLVIDVATGEQVTLPVDGEIQTILFQPDGGTLVRTRTDAGTELVLLDADDQVVARTTESPETADLFLLSYVG